LGWKRFVSPPAPSKVVAVGNRNGYAHGTPASLRSTNDRPNSPPPSSSLLFKLLTTTYVLLVLASLGPLWHTESVAGTASLRADGHVLGSDDLPVKVVERVWVAFGRSARGLGLDGRQWREVLAQMEWVFVWLRRRRQRPDLLEVSCIYVQLEREWKQESIERTCRRHRVRSV